MQRVTGFLSTDAIPLAREGEGERFIEHFWERFPDEEDLRSNVPRDWIKLGMSEPYSAIKPGKVIRLTAAGEWILTSSYHPPFLSTEQRAIVQSLGCTPPSEEVHSKPVTITVVNPSK